jgi:hypothetical protein
MAGRSCLAGVPSMGRLRLFTPAIYGQPSRAELVNSLRAVRATAYRYPPGEKAIAEGHGQANDSRMQSDGKRDLQIMGQKVGCRMEGSMRTITLTEAALALFRLHLEQRRTIDLDQNRETYRELALAGLMSPGSSFAGGDESVYHVTKLGFERKAELLACVREAV